MSRRAPNPAAERAAQNQATIKNLLKLEPNKVCADCKRNKRMYSLFGTELLQSATAPFGPALSLIEFTDPRWASWNLGIFVCIRCSGIHRGMGTHISRVKSVDLDSWTDEQLQSVLNWGNARANKYWEAKLAPGHAPSEAKIENFIRTKYELKRWVMDGPKPDPSTLDVEGDDDVPLSLVKEKQDIGRKESLRKSSAGPSQPPRRVTALEADLIGGDAPNPSRATSTGSNSVRVASKPTNTRDSLLGLDFLGGPIAPPRPASTTGVTSPGGQSRPDLKQSILSLYASVPKPQPQQQQASQQQQQHTFGGMGSPPATSPQQQGSMGDFNDAFGSLTMSHTTRPKPAAADPFASLGSAHTSTRAASQASNSGALGGLSGGGFFDAKPAQPLTSSHQQKPSDSGFGDFSSFSSPPPTQTSSALPPKPAQAASSSAMGDLFDLSAPVTQASLPPPISSPPAATNSVFNLSSQPSKPAAPALTTTTSSNTFASAGLSGADVWGSSEWSSPAPPAAAPTAIAKSPELPTSAVAADFGWGGSSSAAFASTPIVPGVSGGFTPAPKVTADEEFGGWASSTGVASTGAGAAPKTSGGFGADEDLFSNVWQ
ncbi:hypothetical protein E4U60_006552 [Claviceps pazoutovae]|uniref:Arf-GAP domain-containing protein n=1 Tax=Claviceps pazoutovae TaxID=1649127 RepID=A0A9P7SJ81_9HYPO|nr:hypothetical protein E4U60_006552 [Claviceps pazoutovae]